MKLLGNSLLVTLGVLGTAATAIAVPEALSATEIQLQTPESKTVISKRPSKTAFKTLKHSATGAEDVASIVAEIKQSTPELETVIPEAAFTKFKQAPPSHGGVPWTGSDLTPVSTAVVEVTPANSTLELLSSEQSLDFSRSSSPFVGVAQTSTQDPEATEPETAPAHTPEEAVPAETTETEPLNTEKTPEADDSAESDADAVTTESEPAEDTDTTAEQDAESPEEIARRQKLAEGDRLYLAGDLVAAEQLYREAKEPFAREDLETEVAPAPIYKLEQLPPGAAVYWRLYQTGREQQLESKIFAPLKLLVRRYPEFIPGHLHYAQTLEDYEREEESLAVLESAITLYPSEPQLLQAKIEADREADRWLEASLSARQFALFNPEHSQAAAFEQSADRDFERYQDKLKSQITWNAIGNAITGTLGYVLTGNLFGPLSAIETTVLLLQGESGIGERYSKQLQRQLPLVEDEAVLAYVREIGHKLAPIAGRDEFEYEFHVILDDSLNAFALPGGKIFVHAGAILKTESEAELAGLLAHEISHAALSHGFQLVSQGNFIANVAQFIPYGGIAANLIVLDYSRDMERQADILGTKILVAGGYAADGLHNLMVTLEKEHESTPLVWLSTHPNTNERVKYLETLIVRSNFNRYAFEGVTRHNKIKAKVKTIWEDYKNSEEFCRQNRRRCQNQANDGEESELR